MRNLSMILINLVCFFGHTISLQAEQAAPKPRLEKAVFAGGCFWCTESDFQDLPGVEDAVSGYIGGDEKDPTYAQVSSGKTGHTEGVLITFDPAKVTYAELATLYWRSIDPTVKDKQFCDTGSQYRSAIFYFNDEQKKIAEATKKDVERTLKKKVYTQVLAATVFYPAEDYHQDYYKKNPVRYKYYRFSCGRDSRLAELWGDKALVPSKGKPSL